MSHEKKQARLQIFCALLSSTLANSADDAFGLSGDLVELFFPTSYDDQVEIIEELIWKLQKNLSILNNSDSESAADLVKGTAIVIVSRFKKTL